MDPILCQFQNHGQDRCRLIAVEGEQDIPFAIQRVYYFCRVPADEVRGCHAHKTLEQVIICLHGACTIRLDDGESRAEVRLNDPQTGLFVGPGHWRELYDFTPDAVVLVLASQHYDEGDYIRDYSDFLAWRKPSC